MSGASRLLARAFQIGPARPARVGHGDAGLDHDLRSQMIPPLTSRQQPSDAVVIRTGVPAGMRPGALRGLVGRLAAEGGPMLPPFGWHSVLTQWQAAPVVTACVVTLVGLYLWGVVRVGPRAPSPRGPWLPHFLFFP